MTELTFQERACQDFTFEMLNGTKNIQEDSFRKIKHLKNLTVFNASVKFSKISSGIN
jgi:hypothetical protein